MPNYSKSVDFHPHKAPQTQREIDLILFPWRTIRKRANCDVVFVTMPGGLGFKDLHIPFLIVSIPEMPSQLTY